MFISLSSYYKKFVTNRKMLILTNKKEKTLLKSFLTKYKSRLFLYLSRRKKTISREKRKVLSNSNGASADE